MKVPFGLFIKSGDFFHISFDFSTYSLLSRFFKELENQSAQKYIAKIYNSYNDNIKPTWNALHFGRIWVTAGLKTDLCLISKNSVKSSLPMACCLSDKIKFKKNELMPIDVKMHI